MYANTLQYEAVNPFYGIFSGLLNSFSWLFSKDEDLDETIEDDKDKEDTEDFDDDLEDAFGEDDEDDDEEKGKKDDDKDKKDKEKDKKDKDRSSIYQKQKYREKLNKALAEIEQLKQQKQTATDLSEDEKKEKAARDYLAKTIRDVLKETEAEKAKVAAADEDAFSDELEEALDDNTDLKESEILETCEDLNVMPLQAVKILRREMKARGKEKPRMPINKRGGSGEVIEDKSKDAPKRMSLDQINRAIKDKIKRGLL